MSRIQFRQKTQEELQADAATRAKREAASRPAEAAPPPQEAEPAPPAPDAAFSLDGEPAAPKAKKGRKKQGPTA